MNSIFVSYTLALSIIPQILRSGSRFSCDTIPEYPGIMTPLTNFILLVLVLIWLAHDLLTTTR